MQNSELPPLLDKETLEKLIDKAFDVKTKSYSPYSKFRVGSAILTEENEIFVGTNVENCSYGLTICSERVAVTSAVANGFKKFKAIVLTTDMDDFKWMCGACAQVCLEFGDNWLAYSVKPNREYEVRTIRNMLPLAFYPGDLNKFHSELEKKEKNTNHH